MAETLYCGFCDTSFPEHNNTHTTYERALKCPRHINNREPDSDLVPNGDYPTFDYYGSYDNPVPYTNYEGDPANIELLIDNREYEWEGIYLNSSNEDQTLNYWVDKDPEVCTATTNPMELPVIPNQSFRIQTTAFNTQSEQRSLLANNNAFIVVKLLDYLLTAKYHAKLLNIYRGRDQKLHMGLLTFEQLNHPTLGMRPAVTCSYNNCNYGRRNPFFYTGDYSRTSMEDYVIALIRHGNNHGPDWLTKRDDFTLIHHERCDTVHTYIEPCNYNNPLKVSLPITEPDDLKALYSFLQQHIRYCRNTQCLCLTYESQLWDELYGKVLTNA